MPKVNGKKAKIAERIQMFTKKECQIMLNVLRKAASDNEEEMQLILDVRKKLVEEIKNGD